MLKQMIYLLFEVFEFAKEVLQFKHFISRDFCEFSIHSIPSSTRIKNKHWSSIVKHEKHKNTFLKNIYFNHSAGWWLKRENGILTDHNSKTPSPICLKFWLGNSVKPWSSVYSLVNIFWMEWIVFLWKF